MQLFLAEELVGMGVTKYGTDHLTLNGVSYSRGTSFSQKVQAAAEKICRDYLKQNINCFLVKDGAVVTLWVSKSEKALSNVESTHPSSPQAKFAEQASPIQSPEVPREKGRTMTYRGKNYKVDGNEQPSPEVPLESQAEAPKKKRMYRGRAY